MGHDQFIKSVALKRGAVPSFGVYPFGIPAVRDLDELEFTAPVTFFVGENGSGKSTLLESIAVAAGLNAEGGSRNFRFATRLAGSYAIEIAARHGVAAPRNQRRRSSGRFWFGEYSRGTVPVPVRE